MYKFGKKSLAERSTLHPAWKLILDEAIKIIDFSIIEGHRTKKVQDELYNTRVNGKRLTTKRFPMSKHNKLPSLAVDAAPYPIDWKDEKRFFFLAGVLITIAHNMGYRIRWGGDWDSDNNFNDQTFDDLVHFELVLDE